MSIIRRTKTIRRFAIKTKFELEIIITINVWIILQYRYDNDLVGTVNRSGKLGRVRHEVCLLRVVYERYGGSVARIHPSRRVNTPPIGIRDSGACYLANSPTTFRVRPTGVHESVVPVSPASGRARRGPSFRHRNGNNSDRLVRAALLAARRIVPPDSTAAAVSLSTRSVRFSADIGLWRRKPSSAVVSESCY